MDNTLNARAAQCMGIERHQDKVGEYWESNDPAHKYCQEFCPQYTTDANACRELVQEISRRGLDDKFDEVIFVTYMLDGDAPMSTWLLTAPLETLVRMAVEVLEMKNDS